MSPLQDAAPLLVRTAQQDAWTPPPLPLTPADYTATTRELLTRAKAIAGIRAVYDLGPVRFPGLSDLDLLFVLDDRFEAFETLRPLLRASLAPQHHQTLTHNPFFIRTCDLHALFCFAPILQLRAHDGFSHELGLIQPLENTDPLNLALYLADIIAESYPREFILMLLHAPLDERELLARLKGLAYCFSLFARIGGTVEPPWQAFADAVQALRAGFFDGSLKPRRAQTLALTQQAVRLSLQLAEAVARHFEAVWGLRVEGRLAVWAARAGALYQDTEGATPQYAAVRLRHLEVATRAPALFGWLVREYARGTGPFSARLAARIDDQLQVSGQPAPEFAAALARRTALRNDHTAWVDRAGLGLPTFLTFGYRSADAHAPGRNTFRRAAGEILDALRERKLRQALRA